jgi:hypothetical protein
MAGQPDDGGVPLLAFRRDLEFRIGSRRDPTGRDHDGGDEQPRRRQGGNRKNGRITQLDNRAC